MRRSWWWKAGLYAVITALACLAILPTVAPQQHPGRRIQKGLDLQGGLRLVYALETETVAPHQIEDAIAVIDRRVNELGLTEPNIVRKDDEIVVELPGARTEDFERIKAIIGRTAHLQFKLVDDEADDHMKKVIARLPRDGRVTWEREPWADKQSGAQHDLFLLEAPERRDLEVFLAAHPPPPDREWGFEPVVRGEDGEAAPRRRWRAYLLAKRAGVTGQYLAGADESWDDMGRPLVVFTMNRDGTALMEKLTGENVGRRMAILLDDTITCPPRIDEKIGVRGSIILGATDPAALHEEAKALVTVLRSGALPAPLKRTFETQVGPSLGEDAVANAKLAMSIGAAAVVLFMLVYYRLSGLIANLAMVLNLLYMLAILAVLEAALTLPGIAGLVLTVGMAVDANIIIYERIRDELRLGKSPRAAVDAGFSRAFWTVFDAHVTNFVAGVVLFSLGSGPVRGFALTLLIGIVTNLVTSVWMSRWMFDLLVGRRAAPATTLSI